MPPMRELVTRALMVIDENVAEGLRRLKPCPDS